MFDDNFYMQRCFDLAKNGSGKVSPNPLVGSVIVCKDTIIGEGYHKKYGESHAEVNAIASVRDKNLFKEATLYVNLEPCSHWGKTPPCADKIIENKIPRVVIANVDPFPEVSGRGIQKLRNAGIEVTTGVMEDEGYELNKRFFTFHTQKRPYIILKWAQTLDGFIAMKDFSSKWISNKYSRLLVHYWRSREDAIMVGTNTAFYDNPLLTAREMGGRNPVRVVIDRNLRLPKELNLFDGESPTIVFTENERPESNNLKFIKIDFERNFPQNLLSALYHEKLQSVIIEGGSNILSSFLSQGLWDEARIFTGKSVFGTGIDAPRISSENLLHEKTESDLLTVYYNTNSYTKP
jgi:diaminohydroxyphosphoribosylaminopyrimidine deaminase / 5-amino-6-(5-phosphoribosylamino)uracil reductase